MGAWEPTFRYDYLNFSKNVFTDKLADPTLWANSLWMTDVGLNWHATQYVKVMFDWELAMFGQPVMYRPGPGLQSTSDLFWMRMLFYF